MRIGRRRILVYVMTGEMCMAIVHSKVDLFVQKGPWEDGQCPEEDGDKKIEFKPEFLMEHDRDVGAVVVGFYQFMNYYKIQLVITGMQHYVFEKTEDAFSSLPIAMLLVILLMHKNGKVNSSFSLTKEEVEHLTNRIQNGGTEGFEAKAGTGSTNLSMAFAAAKFVDACLHGLWRDAGVVQCAFVASEVTELPYFASKVRLGRAGVEEVFPLVPLSAYERSGLEKLKKELLASIEKGISSIGQ